MVFAQSDQSVCLSLEYSMTVKLLTEHHLGLLSLTGGCIGSSESTLVKMPHCWKSHVTAQISGPFSSKAIATLKVYSKCTRNKLEHKNFQKIQIYGSK